MIKILKGIYIHFLTVLLFVFCYINRNLEILAISYSSVFFHEIAHLIAAITLGLKPSRIIFYPFGVNLKLKNKIIGSLADEIILYISGPLSSAFLAVFFLFFKKNAYFRLFYYNNLALSLFNILPILPMDGGVIFKRILTDRVGYRKSNIILKVLSSVLIIFLLVIHVLLLIKNRFNLSLLIVILFLTGNIFTNKEKYNIDITKQLMFYKQKDKKLLKRVKGYQIKPEVSYKDLIKEFSRANNYIIFKEDKTGKIKEILTEKQIIEEILYK